MNRQTWAQYPSLLKGWVISMAQEFQITDQQAQRYVIDHTEATAEFLRTQGWKVSTYALPPLDEIAPTPSAGYMIEDDCEKLVAWRLTYT